jgi:hypothetical protein
MCTRNLVVGAAALLSSVGVASAQVPSGQERAVINEPGYGTPHSPRNAPKDQVDETTGQVSKFEDRWVSHGPVPYLPPTVILPVPSTTGPILDKGKNPEEQIWYR